MKKHILILIALAAMIAVAIPGTVMADKPPLVVGDANLDGMTSMADVMFIMQYRGGLREFSENQLRCADTTADGMVTMADVMHIMQYRADPDMTLGILYKLLYDPTFHAGMIDPLTQ